MSDDLAVGPVDYLVVEFPGNKMTGEALPMLVDLVDRGIIRILDLVFVRRDLDGTVTVLEIADLDNEGSGELAIFQGASSGLLDAEDIDHAATRSSLAARRASSCSRTGGPPHLSQRCGASGADVVASGRIPAQDLMAAIDKLGPTD